MLKNEVEANGHAFGTRDMDGAKFVKLLSSFVDALPRLQSQAHLASSGTRQKEAE